MDPEVPVHYTVTRMPLDPYAWYEENKGELREGYHPAELMSVECSFASEDDAQAYCDAKNVELYVDTFWKQKLTSKEKAQVDQAVRETKGNPYEGRRTFLRIASAMLQAKVTENIATIVEGMSGGFSYCTTEHYV